MQHRCARCGTVYDASNFSLSKGCVCGSRLFTFVRGEQDAQELQRVEQELQNKETSLEAELMKKVQEHRKTRSIKEVKVEEFIDLGEYVEIRVKEPKEKPAPEKEKKADRFGFETVRITPGGVYKINLDSLFKRKPVIFLEKASGTYFVYLPSIFDKVRPRV